MVPLLLLQLLLNILPLLQQQDLPVLQWRRRVDKRHTGDDADVDGQHRAELIFRPKVEVALDALVVLLRPQVTMLNEGADSVL